MPLSIYQRPVATADQVPAITNWTPILGYVIYQSDTTVNGFFYYQLALAVYKGADLNGTLIATLKQRRNGYSSDVSAGRARAIFDLKDIANSVLVDTISDQNCSGVPFGSIHELGANTYECTSDATPCKPIFSSNGDRNTGETQITRLAVYAYEHYSTDQSDSPSNQPASAPSGISPNESEFYMKASAPLTSARHNTDAGTDPYVFQGNLFKAFCGRSSSSQFLSDVIIQKHNFAGGYQLTGHINYVTDKDFHTLAFLNDFTNFGSDIHKIKISFYEEDGTALNNGFLANSNTGTTLYGGCPPDNSEATGTPANALEDSKRLLYVGVGPANLEAQTINSDLQPSDIGNRGWAYYTVQGFNDAGSGERTRPYYFIEELNDCKGFVTIRLGFRNSLGCYDYFNFKKKSTESLEVERTKYDSMLGIYNKSVWRYNDTDRGVNINEVKATKKQTINTDWITEEQASLIEKCILSSNVYVIANEFENNTQPVIITDTSYTKKTIVNDGVRIQYSLTIEYANQINTNS